MLEVLDAADFTEAVIVAEARGRGLLNQFLQFPSLRFDGTLSAQLRQAAFSVKAEKRGGIKHAGTLAKSSGQPSHCFPIGEVFRSRPVMLG